MAQVNLQDQKLDIIAQIALIEDDSVIKHIKSILDDSFEVPEWQKELVRERIKKTGDNIDNYIPLEQLRKHFKR